MEDAISTPLKSVRASVRNALRGVALLVLTSAFAQEADDMVRIPGGTYMMGSDQGPADERPAHHVMLRSFWLDRYEVTNAQFAVFLATLITDQKNDIRLVEDRIEGGGAVLLLENTRAPDPRTLVALNDHESRIGVRGGRLFVERGFERHPVNEVTWHGARMYCAWRGARLPSEAEWEAAARGFEGRTYPWGEAPPDEGRAVFSRGSNETEPVGSRPFGATPQGVHDLAGNVAEWTSTLYRPFPYEADDGREDAYASGERVTRGGDHVFDSTPEKLRASFRGGFSRAVAAGHRHIGFRCAK